MNTGHSTRAAAEALGRTYANYGSDIRPLLEAYRVPFAHREGVQWALDARRSKVDGTIPGHNRGTDTLHHTLDRLPEPAKTAAWAFIRRRNQLAREAR